jgi:hypothetical protein
MLKIRLKGLASIVMKIGFEKRILFRFFPKNFYSIKYSVKVYGDNEYYNYHYDCSYYLPPFERHFYHPILFHQRAPSVIAIMDDISAHSHVYGNFQSGLTNSGATSNIMDDINAYINRYTM